MTIHTDGADAATPTGHTTGTTSGPTPTATPAAAAGRWALGGELTVSRMGFGAMRLPMRDFGVPAANPEGAVDVLRRAVELGVDHIDTAWFYFHGDLTANGLIRAALHPYPDHLVIATKVGPGRAPDGSWLEAAGPAELRAAVERDLRELGRDHLDLVYLRLLPGQKARPAAHIAENVAALAELRERGLIRHLGLSNATADHLAGAREIAPVAAVQNKFSLTDRRDAALLEACAREGIAYVPFYPLGGTDAPDLARVTARVAARHGATPAQTVLAAQLALAPNVLAIPGTSSLAHLEENVAAAALRLTQEDLAELGALAEAG